MSKKTKLTIDDGCNGELVETALFDGIFEMPKLLPLEKIVIPKGIVPFSERHKSKNFEDFIGFYEDDINFSDLIKNPNDYFDEIKKYPGIISPDCSLYWDMPLTAQIINTYRNRVSCYHSQVSGIYTIPNIRWGDERTYTTEYFPECFPFVGVPKNSMVSVGTYGCISNKEAKHHFKNGLKAMIETLTPEIVLVYGAMPDSIFAPLKNKTQFIQYPDWISRKRKKVA